MLTCRQYCQSSAPSALTLIPGMIKIRKPNLGSRESKGEQLSDFWPDVVVVDEP